MPQLWSQLLQPGSVIHLSPEAPIMVTNACFGNVLSSATAAGRTSVRIAYAEGNQLEQETIICSLTPGKTEQASLYLFLGPGVSHQLESLGKNAIYLSGTTDVPSVPLVLRPSSPAENPKGDSGSKATPSPIRSPGPSPSATNKSTTFPNPSPGSRATSATKSSATKSKMNAVVETRRIATRATSRVKAVPTLSPSPTHESKNPNALALSSVGIAGGLPSASPLPSSASEPMPLAPASLNRAPDDVAKLKDDASSTSAFAGDRTKGSEPSVLEEVTSSDYLHGSGRIATEGKMVSLRFKAKVGDKRGQIIVENIKDGYTFRVGDSASVPGLSDGVIGMRQGGKRTIIVPPSLAYGASGLGNVVPPNATIFIECEVLKVL